MINKLLIGFILIISINTAIAQKSFAIIGSIKDQETYQSLTNVHIINLKTKKGTISNQKGIFRLNVEADDYLKVSFVGYHSKYFKVNPSQNDTIRINLSKKRFQLETVIIYPWTKEEFRYKFVNDTIKTDPTEKLRASINVPANKLEADQKMARTLKAQENNPSMITVTTGIFSNYKTKKEKQIIGLSKLIKFYKAQKEYEKLAQTITGYPNDKLNKFLRYCNFSKRYITYARKYFLALNLKRKMAEFEHKLKTDENCLK